MMDQTPPPDARDRPQAAAPSQPTWRVLPDPADEADYSAAWLQAQCARLPGITAAVLLFPQRGPHGERLHAWPATGFDSTDLARAAAEALAERRTVVRLGRSGTRPHQPEPVVMLVAQPVGCGLEPAAAVAVALATARGAATVPPETLAEQLRWGAGWLEAVPWAREAKDAASRVERTRAVLDALGAVHQHPRLRAAATAVVNRMVSLIPCDRASLGLLRASGHARVLALSGAANLKGKARLLDAIENAMEEAIYQDASVAYPPLPASERTIALTHRALWKAVQLPHAAVMSVCIADSAGQIIGAITLERHQGRAFDDGDRHIAEAIAAVMGPALDVRRAASRLVAGRIVDGLGDGLAMLLGPGRIALKLGAACLAILAVVLVLADGEHRVTAKSVLEGQVQRAAVAPFEGFVKTAPARAGDMVHAGQTLATLDDKDLVLDRMKWQSDREKLVQKQREALAKHDRSSVAVLFAQIQEAEAQLALAEDKLQRTQILAPFDGFVVSGDLSQMLGSPVEKGKVLFEVAPLDAFRVTVQVDERDIRYLSTGQLGAVYFAGLPSEPLPITVTRITPVTQAEDGRNSFRIEARLDRAVPSLRPGMEGIAKVEVGRRRLAWIWTHGMIEWLRLAIWKYLL
jgi:RND family efflux transporter MFP subunit